jgi:hypothetical protein
MKRHAEDDLEDDTRLAKKRAQVSIDPVERFRKGLFDPETVEEYKQRYGDSMP